MDTKLLNWIKDISGDCPQLSQDLQKAIEENPNRISNGYRELLMGYKVDPQGILKVTLEISEQDFTGLVSSLQIPFVSLCAHHFLPFFGTIDIVYEPGPYIIGIGKMPRLVECRSRRFQLQETLVKDLCFDMQRFAKAKGVFVRAVAQHVCVCYRGPKMSPVENRTSYSVGTLNDVEKMNQVVNLLLK